MPAEEKEAPEEEGGGTQGAGGEENGAVAEGAQGGGVEGAPAGPVKGAVDGEGGDAAEGVGEAAPAEMAEPPPPPYAEKGGEKVPLPGCFSLFVTDKTKEIVGALDLGPKEGQVLQKWVEKAVVTEDIRFRGAISDFKEFQKGIEACDMDSILMRDNDDDTFGDGNNLEICCKRASADIWEANVHWNEQLKRKAAEEAGGAGAVGGKGKRKKKAKPVSKPWETLGSETEIQEEKLATSRDLLSFHMQRPRRLFGQEVAFGDRDAHAMWNSAQMECRPFKDPNFDLVRMEQHKGVQAVPSTVAEGVQATAGSKKNGSTQYQARYLDQAAEAKELQDPAMGEFLKAVQNSWEFALQQNEITDTSEDHFDTLAEEDSAPGKRSENVISEFQSFTDLVYSKGKIVSAIDWLPGQEGVVAVSCTEPISLNERLAVAGQARRSAILIWNFVDPIHPQYVLESPFDVFAFRFNTSAPSLIAGGLYNGQVILWDTSSAATLRNRGSSKGEGEKGEASIPVIRPKCLSSLEKSHNACVTDLAWLQKGLHINRMGQLHETEDPGACHCFVTIAVDGRARFWDVRVKRETKKGKEGEIDWTPVWTVSLIRDHGGDLAGTRFSFSNTFRSSSFFVGSMDGEVALAQYEKPEGVDHPEYTKGCIEAHSGPVVSLQRSPFFEGIVLSAGDWTFKIWKEGHTQPLFASSCATTYITAACWSLTRPGVVYIAKQDGVMEVWDFLDRSHEPSIVSTISSHPISSIEFFPVSSVSTMMAVGDTSGTLHIMELPRNLRRRLPHEQTIMQNFIDREAARIEHVERYTVQRDEESKKKGSEHKVEVTGEPGEGEPAEDAETSGLGEKAEEEYQKLEREFREKMGIASEGG